MKSFLSVLIISIVMPVLVAQTNDTTVIKDNVVGQKFDSRQAADEYLSALSPEVFLPKKINHKR